MNPERTTSTDYRNPYRPTALRLINRLADALGLYPTLTAEAIERAALRRAHLPDAPDPAWRAPLNHLLASVHAEARLHPIGQLILQQRLIGNLANRFGVEALALTHPEITATPIQRPIIIAGLQRTGTTLLQRLIAADPRFRALLSWEALNPAPRRSSLLRRGDPRVAEARQAERALSYMAPDFFAIHPIEVNSPEEEVILLDHTFLSTASEALLHVPTFAAWLEAQDQRPAYRYLTLALQCLQWQRGPSQWVLKSPHHLEWLGALLDTFPNATVVWTHRDPLTTIASFSSMIAHARGVFSDHVDPHEVGAHWSRKILRMLERGMDARDEHPGARFIDIHYDDLVRDPIAAIARVYEVAGFDLPASSRRAIDASRRRAPQHRYGRHVYRLGDFGLSADALDVELRRYRERFGVSRR